MEEHIQFAKDIASGYAHPRLQSHVKGMERLNREKAENSANLRVVRRVDEMIGRLRINAKNLMTNAGYGIAEVVEIAAQLCLGTTHQNSPKGQDKIVRSQLESISISRSFPETDPRTLFECMHTA